MELRTFLKIVFFMIGCGTYLMSNGQSKNPTRVAEAKESRCAKKSYCQDFYTNYDFQGQSRFAELSPGDTSSAVLIVYAGKDYRIFTCGDEDLGDIHFKLFEINKEVKKTVKNITKRDTVIYKLDASGQQELNANGEPIVVKRGTINDTTWTRTTKVNETEIFDNLSNKDNVLYWERSITKTKKVLLRLFVPPGDATISECCNIYVGGKLTRSKALKNF